MLRCILLRYICHIVYWLSLVVGLLPTPLHLSNDEFRPTRLYLLHSALVHGVCLVLVQISVYAMNGESFLPSNPILKWTYKATNATKGIAVIFLIVELWRHRRCWLLTITDYLALLERCKWLHALLLLLADMNLDGMHERALIKRRIERLLIAKFCISFATIWLMFISFWQMHPGDAFIFIPLLLINFVLSTVLFTATDYFFYLLCELRRHFVDISIGLRATMVQLRNCYVDTANIQISVNANNDRTYALLMPLAVRVHAFADLHFDCYRLTCRLFQLCQFTSAAIVLRLFVTNVRIVHNILLRFVSDNDAVDNETFAVTFGKYALMFCFYCDALLFVHVIDELLCACNSIDRILRDCTESALELAQYQLLSRALERFALQVKCHRLVFKVCGLFDLDKASSLRYFLTVFIQVSVLMQFDMKLDERN